MKKSSFIVFLTVATLIISSLACSTGPGAKPTQDATPTADVGQPVQPPPEQPTEPASPPPTKPAAPPTQEPPAQQYDTVFPLPPDIKNFMGEGGENPANFQTGMPLDDVIKFYRDAFAKQNLTERELLTAITDTTFSIVFDGYSNGKAIVIQGVDLGGSVNVNIRFEDI